MPMQAGMVATDGAGRIVGTTGLTTQQVDFVRLYVANGGDSTTAARGAGYSDPRTEGYRLRRLPHIQAAIHGERCRDIGELATIGLGRLRMILKDDRLMESTTGAKVMLDAAKAVLNLAGHVAPKAPETDDPAGNGKQMHEMTIAELEAFIRRGEEAAKLAKAVTIEGELVDDAPAGAQQDDSSQADQG